MITLEKAQERLLALAKPLPAEQAELNKATGRYLAEDITALRTQPAKDMSAMDGYAVRHADIPGPWHVIGESAAGGEFSGEVGPAEAVRIFTGAPVPAGTDTVIIQEDTNRNGGEISIAPDFKSSIGRHIRKAGSDFQHGSALVSKGTQLNSAHIGLAAMAGHARLPVAKTPRIALISTGDELVPPGETVGPNQIPSSNSVMLESMLSTLACKITDNLILPDRQPVIEQALGDANADIIVTIGGASVGDHDLVKPALEAAGASINYHKIAMRPGKPVMAGKLGQKIILGLPGNPVSAYVTAFLLLLPLIRHMAGAARPLPTTSEAKVSEKLPANGPRAFFMRGVLSGGCVSPLPSTDSAILKSLSQANCLIFRDIDAAEVNKDELVTCLPL